MSISLVTTSVLTTAQAVALLVIAGTDPRTPALLVAYSVYLPIVLLGASLRATVASLIGPSDSPEFERRASEIVSRSVLFVGAVTAVALVASPALAALLAHDLPGEVRDTTLRAFWLLLPVALLHTIAGALSGALVAANRFRFSAVAYPIAGLIALVVAIPALYAIGPLGTAVGLACGTLAVAVAHLRHASRLGIVVRPSPRSFRDRAQRRVSADVLTGAALGSALQVNLTISLAAVGDRVGAITAYSYAFFLASLILTLASLPLALVTLPALVGAVREHGRQAAARHLVRLAPYAFAVTVPLAAGFAGLGKPLVDWLVEPVAGEAVTGLLFEIGQILMVMVIPATLYYLASAASLPLATAGGRIVVAAGTVGVHAIAVAVAAGDPVAVAWAHAIALTASTGLILFQTLRGLALQTMMRSVVVAGPVFVAAAVFLLAGAIVGEDGAPSTSMAAGAVATALYVFVLKRMSPEITAPFAALVRRTTYAAPST